MTNEQQIIKRLKEKLKYFEEKAKTIKTREGIIAVNVLIANLNYILGEN